jgi:hypothetical protein
MSSWTSKPQSNSSHERLSCLYKYERETSISMACMRGGFKCCELGSEAKGNSVRTLTYKGADPASVSIG